MSEAINLWTIQHAAAWQQAEQTGCLKADGRRVRRDFRQPYQWLIGQMSERLIDYDGAYPIWAWLKRPDLRFKYHLPPGTPGVRITFQATPESMLVSDFVAWHAVLSRQFYTLSEAEDEHFYAEQAAACNNPEAQLLVMQKMEESWQRIFDIALLDQHPEWLGPTRRLQATLGRVAVSQVRRVEPFTAR